MPSVPGLQASSFGRIMVIPKKGTGQNKNKVYGGTPRIGAWDGFRFIFQWKKKTYKVARLVCEAFHGPPPRDRNICMHLDEDNCNNSPDNLKWGTQKENLNAPGFIKYCKGRTGKNSPIVKGRRQRN